jgi:hypothetical protein
VQLILWLGQNSRHKPGPKIANSLLISQVEESRMLQVSIFRTLQEKLTSTDFSILLMGVMTIADEVDSQLAQVMASYTLELQPAMPTRFVASGGLMMKRNTD